jgi:NAD(P)-dependent dehydrogenase (short-subunit alcohol dehydrogenase family)
MTVRFDGRVAIVTGAGGGLGRSHALLLAERGAKVVVNDPGGAVDGSGGSASTADRVVAEIAARGGTAIANYNSVADAAGAANMVRQAVGAFGGIDILVNNAGILRDKTFAKMELADFEQVVAVHLLGSVYATKAAWPVMQERGYGRIVFTSSNSGLYGNFGQSNYGAAKAGVVGLMNVLRQEGARSGILVNTIAPVAATRMTESLMPPELLPYLKPELVSAAVAYLCSEACDVSGHIVAAGAGYYARIQIMEGEGVRFDADRAVTPDMIAENYRRIADMSRPRAYSSSSEEVQVVLRSAGKTTAR